MGVLECHQLTPLNKMVELKNLRMINGKKDKVICLLGAQFWRLRPEKKDTFIYLLGAGFWRL